jgi:hypothetical protein
MKHLIKAAEGLTVSFIVITLDTICKNACFQDGQQGNEEVENKNTTWEAKLTQLCGMKKCVCSKSLWTQKQTLLQNKINNIQGLL